MALVALVQIGTLRREIADLKATAQQKAVPAPPSHALEQPTETSGSPQTPPVAEQTPKPQITTKPPSVPLQQPEGQMSAPLTPQDPKPPKSSAPSPIIDWMLQHWIAVAAAVSLALAGIYLVIYGIENGYLTPLVRIISAAFLGFALIAAGEWMRQRSSDHNPLLPSVFAGGGLVTLYATALGAEALYGLINPGVAFVCLVAVSVGGLALGGRYHIFLTIFGLIGAALAPWLLQADPGAPWIAPAYYIAVLATGVLLAWYRKIYGLLPFAGVLTLGLGLPIVLITEESSTLPQVIFFFSVIGILWGGLLMLPKLPTRVLSLLSPDSRSLDKHTNAKGTLALLIVAYVSYVFKAVADYPTETNLTLLTGVGLFVLSLGGVWALARTRPLLELSAVPVLGLVTLCLLVAGVHATDWMIIIGLAVAAGLCLWLYRFAFEGKLAFAFFGALVVGLSPAALAYFAQPAEHLGQYPWALALLGFAAFATFAASWLAKIAPDLKPTGLYTIAAGGLIALALTVSLDEVALTLALCVVLVLSVVLERRLNLPYVGFAALLGVGGMLARMLVFPGLPFAWEAPWVQVVLGFLGVSLTFAALTLLTSRGDRLHTAAIIALTLLVPSALALILFRVEAGAGISWFGPSHWSLSIVALTYLVSGVSLLGLLRETDHIPQDMRHWIKISGEGVVVGAAIGLLVSAVVYAPVFRMDERVIGTIVFNSLLLTYLMPGALLLLLGQRWPLDVVNPQSSPDARLISYLGFGLVFLWPYMAVRQAFHGAVLTGPIYDAEQTAYTLLTVLLGGVCLLASMRQAAQVQTFVRRAGLILIAVACAKALVVDAADLQGLARVGSFLFLGLILAGLAWVDGKMKAAASPR